MKRVIIVLLSLAFIFVSCTNNVYIDDEIDSPVVKKDIWRVESAYFETANEAIAYIIEQHQSRSVAAKTDDESRTVVLTRPVLAENSDGIENSSSDYVEDESLRGNITVPAAFTGSLTIDFGGYRYDFGNSNEAFFVIEGGDNVYIYNGQSVIFNEASHTPYAVAVNSDTLTIDTHLIDDRRVDNKLLYVGEKGHLRIENNENVTLSGETALVTDGTSGGIIDITNSSVTFTDIYTKYKYMDGTMSDEIDVSIAVEDGARSQINIYSGNVIIEKINKQSDYYNSDTDSVYDKAYLNILGTEENTTIGSRHEVYEIVEKAIENSTGEAGYIVVHDMTHHDRIEATCVAEGNIEYWKCTICAKCFKDERSTEEITEESTLIPINSNAHSLTHVAETKPTCTENGNTEYWHCTLCDKYFSDKGQTEITESQTVIPHHIISTEWENDTDYHWHLCTVDGNKVDIAGHAFTTWTKDEENVWHRECTVCGREEENAHLTHTIVHHEAKAATCTENGNKEYWSCSVCSEYFSDEDGTKTIENKNSVVMNALGHDWNSSWSTDSNKHWHECKRSGCEEKKDENAHTNEFYYSALSKTDSGTPFLTISHKCNICARAVSTEHKKEDGVFHLTPLDGFTYTYNSTTGIATIKVSASKSYTSLRWYDINGKAIACLNENQSSSFSFEPNGKYGFRCELINNNKVIESCYIELKQYK